MCGRSSRVPCSSRSVVLSSVPVTIVESRSIICSRVATATGTTSRRSEMGISAVLPRTVAANPGRAQPHGPRLGRVEEPPARVEVELPIAAVHVWVCPKRMTEDAGLSEHGSCGCRDRRQRGGAGLCGVRAGRPHDRREQLHDQRRTGQDDDHADTGRRRAIGPPGVATAGHGAAAGRRPLASTLGQRPQADAAPGAERAGRRETVAVLALLLLTRGGLDGLFAQAQVDEMPEPRRAPARSGRRAPRGAAGRGAGRGTRWPRR